VGAQASFTPTLEGITTLADAYLDCSAANPRILSLWLHRWMGDVTVTQAVTVRELARADPARGFAELYRAAVRVGRAHIASMINTIVLAYAGASLPLLLLFSVGREPLGDVVTDPVIAQEIVVDAGRPGVRAPS
jgi:hypothetical protein